MSRGNALALSAMTGMRAVAGSSADQARALASEVADKLLANPVIESYRVEVD